MDAAPPLALLIIVSFRTTQGKRSQPSAIEQGPSIQFGKDWRKPDATANQGWLGISVDAREFLLFLFFLLASPPGILHGFHAWNELLQKLWGGGAHFQQAAKPPVKFFFGFQISLEAARQIILEKILRRFFLRADQLK